MPLEECYNSEEVCKALKISRQSLWRSVRDGKIKAFTICGSALRFTSSDIQKFIEENKKQRKVSK